MNSRPRSNAASASARCARAGVAASTKRTARTTFVIYENDIIDDNAKRRDHLRRSDRLPTASPCQKSIDLEVVPAFRGFALRAHQSIRLGSPAPSSPPQQAS